MLKLKPKSTFFQKYCLDKKKVSILLDRVKSNQVQSVEAQSIEKPIKVKEQDYGTKIILLNTQINGQKCGRKLIETIRHSWDQSRKISMV